jgi:hypothetical protein
MAHVSILASLAGGSTLFTVHLTLLCRQVSVAIVLEAALELKGFHWGASSTAMQMFLLFLAAMFVMLCFCGIDATLPGTNLTTFASTAPCLAVFTKLIATPAFLCATVGHECHSLCSASFQACGPVAIACSCRQIMFLSILVATHIAA